MSALALIEAADRLRQKLRGLTFSAPVTHVYQPLDYAWEAHCHYLKLAGNGRKRTVFLGMNPGPWGMAQCGVPFGEIPAVRDWIGISCAVKKPSNEHPKRPVEGFTCQRSEVSGRRLWGLFAEHFPTSKDFFREHFVANYCPLVWMSQSGANLTPDKLSKIEMQPVEAACQAHLSEILEILQPEILVGVGAYAKAQLLRANQNASRPARLIGSIIHPSPASPIANREWPQRPLQELKSLGVW